MDEYAATLKALYEEHQSTAKVGEILGKKADTIAKHLRKIGVAVLPRGGRQKFSVEEAQLRADYQHMTMAQLAAKYGVGETTVWAYLKKYGIKHEKYGDLGHRHRPREFTEEHRKRMSDARKGKYGAAANGNWKGGISQIHRTLRTGIDYQLWRKNALALRGNSCQDCGKVDGDVCPCCGTQVKLHVHHLFSFAKFADKRFDPENSEVLCPKCHYSRHRGKIG